MCVCVSVCVCVCVYFVGMTRITDVLLSLTLDLKI